MTHEKHRQDEEEGDQAFDCKKRLNNGDGEQSSRLERFITNNETIGTFGCKGANQLFPIQQMTSQQIYGGEDILVNQIGDNHFKSDQEIYMNYQPTDKSQQDARQFFQFGPAQNVSFQQIQAKKKRKKRQTWTWNKYYRLLQLFLEYSQQIEGASLSKIATDMGFSTRAIQKKWKEYQKDASILSIKLTLWNKEKILCKKPNKTLFYLQILKDIVRQNGLLTAQQIAKAINSHLKLNKSSQYTKEITQRQILYLLKVGNFTYKRVKLIPWNRNSQQNIKKRSIYCQAYQKYQSKGWDIYFLHQTGINLSIKRTYGWAHNDQNVQVVVPNSKSKDLLLVCIIGKGGVAGWKIYEGSFNKEIFLKIVSILSQSIIGKRRSQKKLLVVDNASINVNKETLDTIKESSFQLLFLPPQSPMLNPVQDFFILLKSKIRSRHWNNKRQLQTASVDAISQFSNYDLDAYYNKINQFVEKGIKKQNM